MTKCWNSTRLWGKEIKHISRRIWKTFSCDCPLFACICRPGCYPQWLQRAAAGYSDISWLENEPACWWEWRLWWRPLISLRWANICFASISKDTTLFTPAVCLLMIRMPTAKKTGVIRIISVNNLSNMAVNQKGHVSWACALWDSARLHVQSSTGVTKRAKTAIYSQMLRYVAITIPDNKQRDEGERLFIIPLWNS